MLEKELKKLLKEASERREKAIENDLECYGFKEFYNIRFFIEKKLHSTFFKNKKAKKIVNHLDEILPFIVCTDEVTLYTIFKLLIEQPNFIKKFRDGLKKYPYKNDDIAQLFKFFYMFLYDNPDKFNSLFDYDILKLLSTSNENNKYYLNIINLLNEKNQRIFLNILSEHIGTIPYLDIKYKGNNQQIIYDNLPLFIQNTQNLYTLMYFVKDNPAALSQVKEYIGNNEEKVIDAIFYEDNYHLKVSDPTLKKFIKLLILDVIKNENVKFSEITVEKGGFSLVLLIGDKVIKLGDRKTKSFPNNPYIIAPLLRKELKMNGESCFVEVTERVDTSTLPSNEELYQLYKNLRDLGLIWTDIKGINVGRLKKENIIHWNENLNPSKNLLGLRTKRGETILKEGDLVLLDADFIYDERDSNIEHTNCKPTYNKFEKRYQREKNMNNKTEKLMTNIFEEENNFQMDEPKGICR